MIIIWQPHLVPLFLCPTLVFSTHLDLGSTQHNSSMARKTPESIRLVLHLLNCAWTWAELENNQFKGGG